MHSPSLSPYSEGGSDVVALLPDQDKTPYEGLNEAKSPSTRTLHLGPPAKSAVNYRIETVDGLPDSIFTGSRNAPSDAAWAELLTGSNMIIYPEEAQIMGFQSLELRNRSGSVGSLTVYHELHCIKLIRHWFYYEYYYPNQTKAEYDEALGHVEHCLETLRLSAMCHGDITVRPFEWLRDDTGRVIGPTVKSGALHQCVDWDRLSACKVNTNLDLRDSTKHNND
ncbi:hypothetical protein NPX13_g1636 [Xylaria arbuscula]|uniref:Uncharacterized protein n=1 Tax=Xylaria arbuscula TaxID=114810 RepID=A0A9W8TPG8_9PEZI|nr:hypothetical protein NPX13_g1636 [Xylaria arbuscula]